MCGIAEDTVERNWCDVAIHDKEILDDMGYGECGLWVLRKNGSYFFRLSSRLRQSEPRVQMPAVFNAFFSWVSPKALDTSPAYLENYAPETQKFFIVRKLGGRSGSIEKVKYLDMVELVLGKELRAAMPKTMDPFYEILDA